MPSRFLAPTFYKSLLQPWREIDWFLLLLPITLTVLGGIMIRSTELHQGVTDWMQHYFFGALGVGLILLISRWRYELLLQWQWGIYAATNLALIAVIFLGTTALGAQRWINIFGFNVQPSEFAKLGVIVTLAALLHKATASRLAVMIRVLVITSIPWILIFLQPDLGTALVFGAIALGMLYWGNARPEWLILMLSPIISAILFNVFLSKWLILIPFGWILITGGLAWISLPWSWIGGFGAAVTNLVAGELGHIFWGLLKDYQKDRLILFLHPEQDPLKGGYHLIQSRIAIGAGELWGRGLNHGTQTQLNFIPEQHTDFIFSAIGEELGFIGCIAVLFIFWLLCLRLLIIAQNARDNFGSLLVIGVFSMLVFQVVINIGMTIGLAPVTGIPLPWISYGRSALLTNFVAIGLAEAVAYRTRRSGLHY